ncbi:MAG: ribonuclease G [Nitrospirae bacterium RBG_19FT_COMBO_55_12]|nr:MAG: ribonuclease G [Nitrospirae bacterium RBG_19FT_COMBO_55_12]
MPSEIIVNAGREETRVALLENGLVTEIYIDRKKDRGIAGNVYKGRVMKVLPGMQAAFIDIGLEKSAFLYVGDVFDSASEYAPMMDDEGLELEVEPKRKRSHAPAIEDLLQEGQEILVQVSKEPISTKGARVTTYISIPGRYLVMMPGINHIGVSRRIEKGEERKRLREIVGRLRKQNTGYIIRTASEGRSEEDFTADIEFLSRLWENILKKKEKASAPALLHNELDLIFRVIRDVFTRDIDRMVIDAPEEYQRVREFVDSYIPQLNRYVKLYDHDEPVFDHHGVEIEISRALGRKVWLKSGGYIIIDQTEALTTIDINTGRYVGKRTLEDTILKTNLEAVREVAYQLRLRNIGGIIILDFIDMEREDNRRKVYAALQEALVRDKAKTTISHISPLGLIEMTRKRIRESLGRTLCEPCPYCDGRGYVKSSRTICYEVLRELRRAFTGAEEKKALVTVNSVVADMLYDEEREGVETLEKEFQKKIVIKADPNLHQEQYEVVMV